MLAASLGTPYEIHTADTILFIEDVATKPFQIDRMLMQLEAGGKIGGCSRARLRRDAGLRQHPDQAYTLEEVVLRVVGDLEVPVAYGLRSGHVSRAQYYFAYWSAGAPERRGRRRQSETTRSRHRDRGFVPRWTRQNHERKEAYSPDRNLRHGHGVAGRHAASSADFMLPARMRRPIRRCRIFWRRSAFRWRSLSLWKILSPGPDLIVIGNAISRGNVELEHVLNSAWRSVPFRKSCTPNFCAGKEVLVVAGTHGKTTTTSMLAWIFDCAGARPSFLIGGIAENFGSSFHLGEGKHFILEGDEYDTAFFDKGPKFLHYFPDSVILTSVEFDHADIYKDLDAVETAFKRLVNLVPQRGCIVAFDSGESVERCLAKAFCPVERYGSAQRQPGRLRISGSIRRAPSGRSLHNGAPWANFEFALAGRIQRLERHGRRRFGVRDAGFRRNRSPQP